MSSARLRVNVAKLQDDICTVDTTVRPANQSMSGQTRFAKYVCTVCTMKPGVHHELCEHVDCASFKIFHLTSPSKQIVRGFQLCI